MANGTDAFVERTLKYAAFSYGCGFVVVMLHTWRLGLPVIGLLDPVYALAGVPFALAALLMTSIVTSLLESAAAVRTGVRQAMSQELATSTQVADAKELAEILATTMGNAFPIVPFAFGLSVRLYRWLTRLLLERITIREPGATTFVLKSRAISIIKAAGAVGYFAQVVINVAFLLLVLGIYAWTIYPLLPKSVGGGAPTHVRMVLDGDKLPVDLVTDFGATAINERTNSIQTGPIDLLYSTAAAHYVRTKSKRIVSISPSIVEAISLDPVPDDSTQPLSTNVVDVLISVHFESNRSSVPSQFEQSLRKAATRLKSNSTLCLLLQGYADNEGTAEYNLRLSGLRVEAVQRIAEAEGLPRQRILAMAYGSTRPQSNGMTASSKAHDRRVDASVEPCKSPS